MSDGQLLKKVTARISDFEAQVTSQMQATSTSLRRCVDFVTSPRGNRGNNNNTNNNNNSSAPSGLRNAFNPTGHAADPLCPDKK